MCSLSHYRCACKQNNHKYLEEYTVSENDKDFWTLSAKYHSVVKCVLINENNHMYISSRGVRLDRMSGQLLKN